MKNYYSLAETAELLSVSKQTLRRWDNNGTLTPTRMPNNCRAYSPELLDEYIHSNFKNDVKESHHEHDSAIKPYSVIEFLQGLAEWL